MRDLIGGHAPPGALRAVPDCPPLAGHGALHVSLTALHDCGPYRELLLQARVTGRCLALLGGDALAVVPQRWDPARRWRR